MALIFNDPRLDGRQLRDLMAVRTAYGLRLAQLRWQSMPAVLALLWQHWPKLINSFSGLPWPMGSAMAGLSAHLPLALLAPAPFARRTGQSIGGRRFGGVRGVLLTKRQLPLQIGDLLFPFNQSPLVLGDQLRLPGQLLA